MNDLETARAAAAELQRLEAARGRLPELEAEARLEAARNEATGKIHELTAALESALASFQDQKAESDREIADLVNHAREVVARRQRLSFEASQIRQIAGSLAYQQIQRDRPGRVLIPAEQFELDSKSEQLLIDAGFPGAKLLTLAESEDDVGAAILSAVAGLSGDQIRKRRDFSPFSGRVLVRTYNPDTSQYEDVWQ